MINTILNTLKPHLLAIIIFFGLTIAFFYPAFNGYKIKQGDIKNFQGMVHEISQFRDDVDEEPLWTNSMFGGMPAFQISVRYSDKILKTVDKIFTGFIPNNSRYFFLYLLGFYLMGVLLGWDNKISIIGAVAFAFSTYFLVILEAGHNSKAHAIGYIPIVFGTYYQLWKSDKKLLYGSLFALALAVEISCNHVQITYYLGIFLAIFSAFKLYAYIQAKKVKELFPVVGMATAAAVLAVLANIAMLYNTYEYGKSTTRGGAVLSISPDGSSNEKNVTGGLERDYVVAWSYGIQESFSLIIPNAKGGASGSLIQTQEDFAKYTDPDQKRVITDVYGGRAQSTLGSYINSYWGDQTFTSGPVYIGAVVAMLFLFACFWVKGKLKWAIILTTLLALALSWGKNFMGLTNLFLDFAPGYNKFRAVTIILALLEFTIPLLAFLGLHQLIKNKPSWDDYKKSYYIVSGVSLGFMLLFWITPDSFFSFLSTMEEQRLNAAQGVSATVLQGYVDGLKSIRIDVFKKDAMRSLAFMIVTAFIIQGYLKGWFKQSWHLVAILGVLILADLWPINKRYLDTEKVRGQYVSWEKKEAAVVPIPASKADEQIFAMELRNRPELATEISESIQAAKRENPRFSALEQTKLKFAKLNMNSNYRVMNLAKSTFNDSYTSFYHKSIGGYHGAKLRRYQDLIEFHFSGALNFQVLNMLNTKYIIQNQGGNEVVIPNNEAFGNAWFVQNLKEVTNPNDAILALKEDQTNLKSTAVVNVTDFPNYAGKNYVTDSIATVVLDSYLPNKLEYTTNSRAAQFLVFSEIYYQPGWTVTIDGAEAEHIRANYLLRGMEIPAGEHKVVFEFRPKSYSIGNGISVAGSILILLLVGVGIYKNKEQKD